MPIEIVFNETMENVEAAVHASLAECGFKVRPSPPGEGIEVKAKMSFWLGERGNGILSLVLPWIFKTESIAAVIGAYQDGTTALTVRSQGTFGGNLASEAMRRATLGMSIGSKQANQADLDRNAAALAKRFAVIDEKLRARLAAKIAYEGPVKPGIEQVLA